MTYRSAMLQPGSLAPAFSLQDDEGNTRSLADFAGKTLILWFFPKADTPGCTIEGNGFRAMKSEFDAKNAVICGVSFDTVADNRAFRKKFDYPFALLCDTDKQLSIACGAAADEHAKHPKRMTVVIGADGKVSMVFANVQPAQHPQEVLAAL